MGNPLCLLRSDQNLSREAVMSRAPTKSKPTKQDISRKTTGISQFDPAAFLATAAPGRDISRHAKKGVIFAQGDDADAVFYIKKGKWKGSCCRSPGTGRICRRRIPDRTAETFGDSVRNDGMRDDAR